ncbi:unnamed protein product [Triticum turgidum subsp. durum]|uniref:Endoglucanase n=1 Tax=Triticum turgidum subsp. durum TaxID=4567 RepID=A0A9R1RPM9_TRITD|nr:unnamed protein product [Triticum turgidum subsp. durum]
MHSQNHWGGAFDIDGAEDDQSRNMDIDRGALQHQHQLDETQQSWLLGPPEAKKKDRYVDLGCVVVKRKLLWWMLWVVLGAFVLIGLPIIIAKNIPKKKPHAPPPDKYTDALHKALLFFNAQKSGKLPKNNGIPWRGNSGMKDGADLPDVKGGLVGGYYDAGDNIKFHFPMAFSMTLLSWSVVEYADRYKAIGEYDHVRELIKWGTDYLLLTFNSSASTINKLYIGGYRQDQRQHAGRPLLLEPAGGHGVPAAGPAGERGPGPRRRGGGGAGLSLHRVPRQRRLLQEAGEGRGDGVQVRARQREAHPLLPGQPCHRVLLQLHQLLGRVHVERLLDVLRHGQQQLHQLRHRPQAAQERQGLLQHPRLLRLQLGQQAPRRHAAAVAAAHVPQPRLSLRGVAHGLPQRHQHEHVHVFSQVQRVQLHQGRARPIQPRPGPGAAVRRRQLLPRRALRRLHGVRQRPRLVLRPQLHDRRRPPLLRQIPGDNPMKMSYVVGYGKKYPKRLHHRGASTPKNGIKYSCTGGNKWRDSKKADPHVLVGAMVGGPDKNDKFKDARISYAQNEPTLVGNAGLVAALVAITNSGRGTGVGAVDKNTMFSAVPPMFPAAPPPPATWKP